MTHAPTHASTPLPKLRTLGGSSPTPALMADLEALLALPPAAKAALWDALSASLPDPVPASAEATLDAFCQRHGVADMHLARAVRCCRALIREASRHDLDSSALADDLALMHPRAAELEDLLLRGYEAARAQVRQEMTLRSILAHGKTLVDVEWRLDVVASSTHGRGLRAPVGVLTLRYQENGRQEAITLQALPGVLQKIEQVCQQMRT